MKLRNKKTGRSLHYFNTHLDPHDGHARYESALDIIRYVNQTKTGDPIFLGGDFNSKKTSRPYEYIAQFMEPALKAVDPLGTHNKDESTNSGFSFDHPKTIDFIFYKDNTSKVKVNLYEVLPSKAHDIVFSDHAPIIADFTI